MGEVKMYYLIKFLTTVALFAIYIVILINDSQKLVMLSTFSWFFINFFTCVGIWNVVALAEEIYLAFKRGRK
jgi:hypothetical protein